MPSTRLIVNAVMLVIVVLAFAGMDWYDRQNPRSQPYSVLAESAATPEGAIRVYLEERGELYAGVCEQTRSPEHIGMVCSKRVETRDGMEAHLVGRTFSEFSHWLFLAESKHGWMVAESRPLDFLAPRLEIPWP